MRRASAAEADLAITLRCADLDVCDLRGTDSDVAVAPIGEPQHVDGAGERCFDLGPESLSVEIVGQLEGEFAGAWVTPMRTSTSVLSKRVATIVETDHQSWNSVGGLIRGNHVIDAMGATGDDLVVARRSVVIVAFDGMQPLDAIGPHEVFAGATAVLASRNRKAAGYDLTLVSERGTPITTESGLQIITSPLLARQTRIDTLLIPGGEGAQTARHRESLVAWIRDVARYSRRIGTVCTGAFIAAEAGLLDGRTVTTHWARARQLADEYPLLDVDQDPIYRRDGTVWTSAGVTAGIDLSLAMVEADYGGDVAQTVARWMVMFLHRPGGQTQFSVPVWVPRASRSTVRDVQDFIDNHPSDDHRLDLLAGRVGHEFQTLQPGVHRSGRRDTGALRRAGSRRGGASRAGDVGVLARSHRNHLWVRYGRVDAPGVPATRRRRARCLPAPISFTCHHPPRLLHAVS